MDALFDAARGGVVIENIEWTTPKGMAKHLSKSLSCPSSIVAGTANHFGKDRAVSRSFAEELVALRKAERKKPFWSTGSRDSDTNDGRDFDPRHRDRPSRKIKYVSNPRSQIVPGKPEPSLALPVGPLVGPFEHKLMIAQVAKACGSDYYKVVGPSRLPRLVSIRTICAQLLRQRNPEVYVTSHIAGILGRTDHTTVLNYFAKFQRVIDKNPDLREVYEAFLKRNEMHGKRGTS